MKVRKKPVVVEAYQWHEPAEDPEFKGSRHNMQDWPKWLEDASNKDATEAGAFYRVGDDLVIKTLEGCHEVVDGDWIIQGVAGELYPRKPEIFEATYDPADEIDPAAPPTPHDIGWAVKEMWNGEHVCRPGWNGKGMFLFVCSGGVLREGLGEGPEACQPFVVMKTAQNMLVPWICSQSDLLAIDWELAE